MNLRPCPFCGGAVMAVENYMRQYPRMDGRYQEPQLLSVTISHHCPRLTDSKGNYPVLAQYIEVRGRDHETAAAAWNKRAAP